MMVDRTWYSRTGAGASSTASTPNSADSFHNLQDHEGYSAGKGEINRPDRLGELVSPSRMNLPSRKRSHSKHLDGLAPYENKSQSRRTSPGSYQTRPSTPSTSISGYEYPIGDGYFDLTLFVHIHLSCPVLPFLHCHVNLSMS